MRGLLISVTFFSLCFFIFAPLQTHAQSTSAEREHRAILLQIIDLLQQQILLLKAESNKEEDVIAVLDDRQAFVRSSVDKVKSYKINRPSDIDRIKNPKHKTYFTRVFDIFPTKYDKKIERILVFDAEDYRYDAFVETLPPDHEKWRYATSEAMLDFVDSESNSELIVHELAHIVSYEEITGLVKLAQQNCETYFENGGCPASNSFLREFMNEFWSSRDLDRAEDWVGSSSLLDEAYEYYLAHDKEFVSDYATISPEEDFAESFMFFVFELPVEVGEVEQKIEFMESFSELRSIKREILENE